MSMKILATSDWHLGNLFHGNDRLPEHKYFLKWLLEQIAGQKPDALLIAGDIFDNGNPSAAAQTVYYEFLADATQLCHHYRRQPRFRQPTGGSPSAAHPIPCGNKRKRKENLEAGRKRGR